MLTPHHAGTAVKIVASRLSPNRTVLHAPSARHRAAVSAITRSDSLAPSASPGVAKTDVTLDTVADKGPIETKLIAGLGVDTGTWIELGGDTACKLQPRRLFDQRHLIDSKRRRRASVPIAPKIGTRIRLPYLAIVANDGP